MSDTQTSQAFQDLFEIKVAPHPNATPWANVVRPVSEYKKLFFTNKHKKHPQWPVWFAKHMKTGLVVIVKHVKKESEWAMHYVAQYSEVHADTGCYHPNIVRLFAVFDNTDSTVEVEGKFYTGGYLVVMEHADGEQSDLITKFVADRETGEIDKWNFHGILEQTTSAIQQVNSYAESWITSTHDETLAFVRPGSILSLIEEPSHNLPFIAHNDIKPDNMFMFADGTIKLGDFGAATLQGEPTSHVTLLYGAPEQLGGVCSDTSDWFGLAAMMYSLTSGQHYRTIRAHSVAQLSPLQRKNILAGGFTTVESKVRSAFAKHFSESETNELLKCLSVDPDDRPIVFRCD